MAVTEERIEEGLNALREWEKHKGEQGNHVGRYFKVSNRNYHAEANAGNFDDLMESHEFIKRALQENLEVPFYEYCQWGRTMTHEIASDKELVRLGMPLEQASELLKSDIELVAEILPRNPNTILNIDYDLRSNPQIAMAALDGFADWLANFEAPKEQQFQREWLGEHFPRQKDAAVILRLMILTGESCRQSLSQEGAKEAYEALAEKRASLAEVESPEVDTQSWSDRIETSQSFDMAR